MHILHDRDHPTSISMYSRRSKSNNVAPSESYVGNAVSKPHTNNNSDSENLDWIGGLKDIRSEEEKMWVQRKVIKA